MPAEICNKIWKFVLGDQLIHLEYIRRNSAGRQIFRHVVCEDDRPEDGMVEDSTWIKSNGDEEIVWRQPHYHCDVQLAYNHRADPKLWDHKCMHLSALRVCRQIYSEASDVLWTTNTFSFNDAALSFHCFMEERTTYQKQLLRRLRLQMDWVWGEDGPWNCALDMALIKSLTGLRSLRLQINHSVGAWSYQQARALGGAFALFEPGHLELVHRMAVMPLANVEVFVGDRSQPHNLNTLWTAEDRKEYAEGIRKILLDPNGTKFAQGLEDWDRYNRQFRQIGEERWRSDL